jgi:hypothetical protein
VFAPANRRILSRWSDGGIQSALTRGVLEVIGVGPEEEVFGTDTIPNIAVMTNQKPCRDWAVSQFVREAMCFDLTEVTIGAATVGPFPDPAPVGFIYEVPEAGGALFGRHPRVDPVSFGARITEWHES